MRASASEAFIRESAALLELMGSEKRLVILSILVRGEISVSALARITDMRVSTLSQHLSKLRAARLVDSRRDAQTIFYSCRSEPVRRVVTLLHEIAGEKELHQARAAKRLSSS